MQMKTICFVEIVCLIADIFYFHAAILHICFLVALFVSAVWCLVNNRRLALYAFGAIPLVCLLSTVGYLVESYMKLLVTSNGDTCFHGAKCDLPKSVLGYRIQIALKSQGRAQDMIILDGHNDSYIIYDPVLHSFERAND